MFPVNIVFSAKGIMIFRARAKAHGPGAGRAGLFRRGQKKKVKYSAPDSGSVHGTGRPSAIPAGQGGENSALAASGADAFAKYNPEARTLH